MLLCVSELVLTRVTGGQSVAPITVAVSAAAFLALALAPSLALDLLCPPAARRARIALPTLLGWGLCTLIAVGILGPVVVSIAGKGAAMASAAVLFGAIAALSRLTRGSSMSPYPAPAAVMVHLAVATIGAWLLGPGSLPTPFTMAVLAAAGGTIGVAASWTRGTAPAGLLGLLTAMVPLPLHHIAWPIREAAHGPDLVLISVDALRFDTAREMSVYQDLAAGGTEFTAAQSPAPWTLPAVASLLTGVAPATHGAGAQRMGVYSAVASDAPALATDLAGLGYDTVGVIAANPFAGASFGANRGFDYFYEPGWRPGSLPRGTSNHAACPLLVRLVERSSKPILCQSVDGAAVTDHALQVLAQRRDRPLFLWIHLLDAHLPYRHTVDPSVSETTLSVVRSDDRSELEKLQGSPLLKAELRAANRDEVRFVDGQVRRVLDALGPTPDAGRIVVLTADHGEEFYEHGGFEHGHALFQEVVHVPLVISGLHLEARAVDTPVALMDVAATLLTAAGGHDPAMTGMDLAGALDGDRVLRSGNMLRIAPDEMFAIRRGPWKAIWHVDGQHSLFDLASDPGEAHNLAADQDATFRGMTAGQSRQSLPARTSVAISQEQTEMLEALGYAEPAH